MNAPPASRCPGWCASTDPHTIHHTAPVIIPFAKDSRATFTVDLSLVDGGAKPKINVVYLGETPATDGRWHYCLPEAGDVAKLLAATGAAAVAAAVTRCAQAWSDSQIMNPVTHALEPLPAVTS